MDEAVSELGPDFQLFIAERLFVKTFLRYFAEACTGAARQKRVDALVARAIAEVPRAANMVPTIRREVEAITRPNATMLREFANVFLLADRPENADRFDLDALFTEISSHLPPET